MITVSELDDNDNGRGSDSGGGDKHLLKFFIS
jgi:hypothetical protein